MVMTGPERGTVPPDAFLGPILYTFCAFLLFFVVVKVLNYCLSDSHAKVLTPSKTHSWKSTQIFHGAYFCGICEMLVTVSEGLFCGSCGIYSHPKCSKSANKTLPCKVVSQSEPLKHHWVLGNLSRDSICDVCEDDCEGGLSKDLRCCWCSRTVHSRCRPNIAEVCDFGRYRRLVIPPSSVHLMHHKNRLRRRQILKSVSPPTWTDWSPLIVIANAKAGSNDADHVVALLAGFLNPAQVSTVGPGKMEAALEWCRLIKDIPCRVLVAGGDGTVAWVLNTIHSLKLPQTPAVGILPFGTGNDLSRVLGWGPGMEASEVNPTDILDEVLDAEVVHVDRWSVRVQPLRSIPLKSNVREIFMYNYAGFGVDAQVTLNFHRTRQSSLYLFNSRLFNKMLYVCFGTGELIEKTYKNLQEGIDLYLDGNLIELPAIEGIVVLNIDSYGAGMHLWEMGYEENPHGPVHSMSDKKLEVVAFYSSFHMGGLQMGVGLPHRIGQARAVRVVLHRDVAVQVDGEPWYQSPAEFNFKAINQAVMLKKRSVSSPKRF